MLFGENLDVNPIHAVLLSRLLLPVTTPAAETPVLFRHTTVITTDERRTLTQSRSYCPMARASNSQSGISGPSSQIHCAIQTLTTLMASVSGMPTRRKSPNV